MFCFNFFIFGGLLLQTNPLEDDDLLLENPCFKIFFTYETLVGLWFFFSTISFIFKALQIYSINFFFFFLVLGFPSQKLLYNFFQTNNDLQMEWFYVKLHSKKQLKRTGLPSICFHYFHFVAFVMFNPKLQTTKNSETQLLSNVYV